MTISQLRPGDHRRDECLAIFLGWIRGLEQRRILLGRSCRRQSVHRCNVRVEPTLYRRVRSEEHTSELQSLMRISYAVFCLKKKTNTTTQHKKQQIIKHILYYLTSTITTQTTHP